MSNSVHQSASLKTVKNAWQVNAKEMAAWGWDRITVKRDRYGRYCTEGGALWSQSELSVEIMEAHFSGDVTIGLGVTSLDDECILIAWDLDNHVSDEATNVNLKYATLIMDRLRELGFQPLIEDSDGKGGIHVWLFFSSRIPASVAFHFARWVVRDHKDYGVEKIECFPKQPSVQKTKKRCGNYIRTPGKHHKRDHWSRFWGTEDWLSLTDSVQLLLSLDGCDPTLIPALEVDESAVIASIPDVSLVTNDQDVFNRMRQHVSTTPGAIAGEHGHDVTFRMACDLLRGFGKVSIQQVMPIFKDWNAKCSPPWSDEELQHKLEDATNTTGKIGYLLVPGIKMSLNERTVNDHVISVLASRGDVYDFNGHLAMISFKQIDGEAPRRTIQRLSLPTLREIISSTCVLQGDEEESQTGKRGKAGRRIPRWCSEAIQARGHWNGIRRIRGVVTSPVLRADGSILQAEGYDPDSGLYVDLSQDFPVLEESPSMDQIQQALALLKSIVSDFPFKEAASYSAWLASLLTPLAREAYSGCTGPLFLFDANVRASGKSLLADINSLIVTGREATRMTAPRDEDEARKRITALVNDAELLVLIDNISGRFGCSSLDAALTGTIWKDRRLGHTELIEARLRMTWYGSGNNVILAGDTPRRVCYIRLESPMENPEDRDNFQHADIRGYVRSNRPAILAAALTILRGFIAAGRPDQHLKPWGSYEGWSGLVRNTIVWCGLPDPGETRIELRETSDTDVGCLRQLLSIMEDIDPQAWGLRASSLLLRATRDSHESSQQLKEALESCSERLLQNTTAQRLGERLASFRGRVLDQRALAVRIKQGCRYWYVEKMSPSGGPGGPGGPGGANPDNLDISIPVTSPKKTLRKKQKVKRSKNSPTWPTCPTSANAKSKKVQQPKKKVKPQTKKSKSTSDSQASNCSDESTITNSTPKRIHKNIASSKSGGSKRTSKRASNADKP